MTRLALVLGGGSSLGAYSAGAATELYRALRENRKTERLTIDVICGSSTGSINAAILARTLVVNSTLLPWLERLWIEVADAGVLLDSERTDRSSLLSGPAVSELSHALIASAGASDDAPSKLAGRQLGLGLTLTNLSGLPLDFRYGSLDPSDRSYSATVHRDAMTFELGPGNRAGDPVWERVRQSALASAGFPIAGTTRTLERSMEEYPGLRIKSEGDFVRMWYVDGAVHGAPPLALARKLAGRAPADGGEWRYLLVDPLMRSGPIVDDVSEDSARPMPMRTMERLVSAMRGWVAADDWQEANRTNARLDILEEIVEQLPDIADRLVDPADVEIGRTVGELAERVAEMKVAEQRGSEEPFGDPVVAYLDQNANRIAADDRYASAFGRVETRAARTRLAKLIFVLEAASGLRDKQPMALHLIAPEPGQKLAGQFLGGFGGFLSRDWRANDFRTGRRDARRVLESELGDIIDYRTDEDAAYEVRPLDPTFENMPPAARERLDRFIEGEADKLLDQFEPGALASIFSFAWKPAARRWLSRRVIESMKSL